MKFNIFSKIFGNNKEEKSIGDYNDNINSIFSNFFGLDNTGYISDYGSFYNGWQFKAINAISKKIAGLDYGIFYNGKKINHTNSKLITYDLLENITSYYNLYGTAYLKVDKIGNRIVKLRVLNTGNVTLQFKPGTFEISEFRYNQNGKQYFYDIEEIITIASFNPNLPYPFNKIGIGPLQSIILQILTDEETLKWNKNFFKNGTSLGSILSTDKKIDPEAKKKLANAFMSKYLGTKNAHKLAILDNGFKFENIKIGQKELDFVEQRGFTRDEILATFGVPKAIIGLGEQVNVGNVDAFERIFISNTIIPIAKKIENALNSFGLFGENEFKFLNIIKEDHNEIRQNYIAGLISLNEARLKLGENIIDSGNVLINGEEIKGKNNNTTEVKKSFLDFSKFEKKIKELEFGTEEYNEKIVKNIDEDINEKEKVFESGIKKVWNIQKDKIEKEVKGSKTIKEIKDNVNSVFSKSLLWAGLYYNSLKNILKDVYKNNVNFREKELENLLKDNGINIDLLFRTGDKDISEEIKKQIRDLSNSLDDTSKKLILEEIDILQDKGYGVKEIVNKLSDKFNDFDINRLNTITRTELLTAANNATMKVFENNTDIVDEKEWYAALDERTCEHCGPLHGKKIKVNDNFFNKGDITSGGMKLDYKDIKSPPLHPNCRCILVPVLKKDIKKG